MALQEALAQAGVVLFVRDGKLRARGAAALTDELHTGIEQHRAELLLRLGDGPQNSQNAQNSAAGDVTWIRGRLQSVYGLLKEALREGYLGPAQRISADVVEAILAVARQDGDVARACRLASRDGAGNDVAAAALLATYGELCRRLGACGVDPLRRRAALALMLARAAEESSDVLGKGDGTRGRRAG
jgi:hypothetical protein